MRRAFSSAIKHGLERRVIYRNRIIENNHYSVTSVAFERTAVLDDDGIAEERKRYSAITFFWVGAFKETLNSSANGRSQVSGLASVGLGPATMPSTSVWGGQ